jgi:heterotetrameric sarcosine oxidase gamma subunit
MPFTTTRPVRLSPIHTQHVALGARLLEVAGWQAPQAYDTLARETAVIQQGAGLLDISFKGKVSVKGTAAGDLIRQLFQIESGDRLTVSSTATITSARLTAAEYLLLAAPGGEVHAIRCLEEARAAGVTVIDLTHGLAGFLLAGPESRAVLRKLGALPFDPLDFPHGRVAQTSLAKVHATILHQSLNDAPAYEIYVDRSYGDYVWAAINDAGKEVGLVPVGWQVMGEA